MERTTVEQEQPLSYKKFNITGSATEKKKFCENS